ncbi:hypothetical protein [Mucilaginibacter jinjuensis]|uniref:Carboxypeptidase family protein n=1 Tax=Mucilaginibacter jinjuensis TaxID=1176721 RepID=A0ABY7TD70_9SPHI|nr:hypothetical protein [Mucilaginibacter jinjuensis]WCT13572.1 hypothetical protein PQO05_06430 [Mucilaginibacter jinjuensis]
MKAGDKMVNNKCDIVSIQQQNSSRITITNGVWGTVSLLQGNCMPTTDKNSTCSQCPVEREVRIYNYTTIQDIVPADDNPALAKSFKTQLIKTVMADERGFYQADLPEGKYTIVVVEDGKLYAPTFDGNGGLSSVAVKPGRVNFNLVLNHALD